MEAVISNRTVLVGGGATGIGHATAEHLARAGHRVVITGRRATALRTAAAELIRSTGGTVDWLVSDVTDPDTAEATVGEAERRYGALDVLVLNAGGPPPGRVLEVDDKEWQSAFELLLLGPLRLARLALPAMAARGFGRVVFVTSTAVRRPQPDLAASVVLRSAVTAAAKLLSREFAVHGVTVNCVAPGPTATERRRQILTGRAQATGRDYADLDGEDAASVPVGRAAHPQEIGAAVAFLASAAASYVNGTVLTVDGGRTETI
ncbi:3-oxoacyl-[acyl-carrier protein] reductase [Streptomyces aurantiacus]|uniref:SDR family oxidoreductase n=1 Tax=Streptomyces aurantiacus TaxID=47760 RepID=UPI0027907778|nr:SDR family oxidoreductase [Streptomyces aurantiacus]MDQ0778821.1 3-oxoacyl-[acyl-carrier protein] reductase [Streptomyces aurantiacus]